MHYWFRLICQIPYFAIFSVLFFVWHSTHPGLFVVSLHLAVVMSGSLLIVTSILQGNSLPILLVRMYGVVANNLQSVKIKKKHEKQCLTAAF